MKRLVGMEKYWVVSDYAVVEHAAVGSLAPAWHNWHHCRDIDEPENLVAVSLFDVSRNCLLVIAAQTELELVAQYEDRIYSAGVQHYGDLAAESPFPAAKAGLLVLVM